MGGQYPRYDTYTNVDIDTYYTYMGILHGKEHGTRNGRLGLRIGAKHMAFPTIFAPQYTVILLLGVPRNANSEVSKTWGSLMERPVLVDWKSKSVGALM